MFTRTKIPKHRKGAWFVPIRGSYLPVSWQGWLTYIPFIAYLVFTFVGARTIAHGIWQTILWTVPNWVAAAVIMTWVAKRTS